MDVYGAIMKAAGHIEASPWLFEFTRFCIPECGSLGCALGWIGTFAGKTPNHVGATTEVPYEILGFTRRQHCGDAIFYQRLDEAVGTKNWRGDASLCAQALRLYAAKYHAPAQRTDSELVADLMARVCGERIPEEA